MFAFLLRRVLSTVPVLLVVAVIVFLMLRLTPGDPAAAIVGDSGTAADIQRVRTQLGLDVSLLNQFVTWGSKILHGDLGTSFFQQQAITTLISQRVEPTLSLALFTISIAVLFAVPMGVLAAWRRGGWLDRVLMGVSVVSFSIPVFVSAYLAIWLFSLHLQWFPSQGYSPISDGLWPWAQRLIMPASTLSLLYTALIARVTRAAVAEALSEDFVRTARSKGISEARVLLKHALVNSAVPVITVIGLGIALLIGGVVVTETVYAIPGLGQLTVEAVLARDYPLIQGLTLFFSFTYVVVNFAIDVSYTIFDPRVRY
ncbi:ABC transporter permease [Cupriavidus basilensis]